MCGVLINYHKERTSLKRYFQEHGKEEENVLEFINKAQSFKSVQAIMTCSVYSFSFLKIKCNEKQKKKKKKKKKVRGRYVEHKCKCR